MGFSSTKHCSGIPDWEAAEKHFARTPRPRERGARPVWTDDTRPLDNARKWHYRLERAPAGEFYDVCLYHTVMARYYKPEGDTRRVAYNFDSRITSSEFMWQVTGSARIMAFTTTDGRKVDVPVCSGGRNAGFGTELTLVGGKLDISRSKHAPIGTRVMSDEKRAWLKLLRAHVAPFLSLMEVRVEGLMDAYEHPTSTTRSRFFSGVDKSEFAMRMAGILTSEFEFTQTSTDYLCTVYDDKVKGTLYAAVANKETRTRAYVAKAASQALVQAIARIYNGKVRMAKPLPQFPAVLPKTFVEL